MTTYKYNIKKGKYIQNGRVLCEGEVLDKLRRLAILEKQIKKEKIK